MSWRVNNQEQLFVRYVLFVKLTMIYDYIHIKKALNNFKTLSAQNFQLNLCSIDLRFPNNGSLKFLLCLDVH